MALKDWIAEFIMTFTDCIPNERLSTNRHERKKIRHVRFVHFSLSTFRSFPKFFAIINLDTKKRDKNCKAMCSIHLFTNCGKHRRLCGLRYHCLQLWLGCQWGIWGAGWGRQEGLGAVIKLPLFPPGSLQGSNSALIGQQVTRQPRDPVRLVTPGDRWEHSRFIILNLSETSG